MCGPGKFAGVNFAFSRFRRRKSPRFPVVGIVITATAQVETRIGKGSTVATSTSSDTDFHSLFRFWACDVEEMVVCSHDAWLTGLAEVKNLTPLDAVNIGAFSILPNLSVPR